MVSDICLFVQYAHTLFNFHPQLNSYRHFHMYIHRVALSVILPQQEAKSDPFSDTIFQPFPTILEEVNPLLQASTTPQSFPEFAVRGSKITQSLPRRFKQKTVSETEKPRPRSSIQSDHSVVHSIVSKSSKNVKRGMFTKQHSIHEKEDSNFTLQGVTGSEVCMYDIILCIGPIC